VQIQRAPDSNVRTAPPGAGRDRAQTAVRRMARSLLSFRLFQLVLLATVSSMSACIIPVAPNFQDPPPPPESGPRVSNYNPLLNQVVTVPDPLHQGQTFSVSVIDPDVKATIYSRWVVDYPPYGNNTRYSNLGQIPPPIDGKPISHSVAVTVTCGLLNVTVAPAYGIHQLELVIADGPFSDDPQSLDSTIDSTNAISQVPWSFVISCPAPSSSASP
jgi:hypothetical protein